jgi:hypothetical protein
MVVVGEVVAGFEDQFGQGVPAGGSVLTRRGQRRQRKRQSPRQGRRVPVPDARKGAVVEPGYLRPVPVCRETYE